MPPLKIPPDDVKAIAAYIHSVLPARGDKARRPQVRRSS